MRVLVLASVAMALWLAWMPAQAACPTSSACGVETMPVPAPLPGTAFRDCPDCPEMVVIPAGSFMMGVSDSDEFKVPYEIPQHRVTVGAFAMGKTHVTRAEYAVFAAEVSKEEVRKSDSGIRMMPIVTKTVTRYPGVADCQGFVLFSDSRLSASGDWLSPGYSQAERDPAVCISWTDAQAYVSWLNGKLRGGVSSASPGGGPYRLPSEAEWEYAARAGTTTMWFWGDTDDRQCEYANLADLSLQDQYRKSVVATCRDGYAATSPAGSFQPNPFGLYDMAGNAWQWTEDCWRDNYLGAPGDGRASTTGECGRRVVRGGSWNIGGLESRSSWRFSNSPDSRVRDVGFRLVKTLP